MPLLDETISSLLSCEQVLPTLRERLGGDVLDSAYDDSETSGSRLVEQLESCHGRLNIVLDICALYFIRDSRLVPSG